MLELAILGLLKERSMHGYQLSKRLTDSLGGFWRVSYGSLYPSLKRLERQGEIGAAPVEGRAERVGGAGPDLHRCFSPSLVRPGGRIPPRVPRDWNDQTIGDDQRE